jgi:hypothetical protein
VLQNLLRKEMKKRKHLYAEARMLRDRAFNRCLMPFVTGTEPNSAAKAATRSTGSARRKDFSIISDSQRQVLKS